MSKIVYKRATQKRSRYDSFEKQFLIYIIILALACIFLPIVAIKQWSTILSQTSLLSKSMWISAIFSWLILIFLVIWNTSYRFKKFFYSYIGFKESDWVINFWALLLLATQLLTINWNIWFFQDRFSTQIQSTKGFLWLAILLSIGLIWNLVLTIQKSIKNNKPWKTYIEHWKLDTEAIIWEKETGLFDPKDL